MAPTDQLLATLASQEEAEHWLSLLGEHGLRGSTALRGDGVEVWVAAGDYTRAAALFMPPEGVEELDDDDSLGPSLGDDERTSVLVQTEHALVARKLCARLHAAGLFADVINSGAASMLGGLGQPTFTVRVSERQRGEARDLLKVWASDHANDFAPSVGLSRQELLELLLHFASSP
jgi:hypothetical protein